MVSGFRVGVGVKVRLGTMVAVGVRVAVGWGVRDGKRTGVLVAEVAGTTGTGGGVGPHAAIIVKIKTVMSRYLIFIAFFASWS